MGTMDEDFEAWRQKAKKEYSHVYGLMSEKLSDEPERLINDLQEIEAWNGRMGFLLAEANTWLDMYTWKLMPAKEGRTDFERKSLSDDAVAEYRGLRDKIESMCDAIRQRITLGQSILSYSKMFADRQVMKTPARSF